MNYKTMKNLLIIIISIFFTTNLSFSQSKLPECIKLNENTNLLIDFKTFNNCNAKIQFENRDIYEGEFKNGQMHGVGNYYNYFPTDSGYQGEFKNNKFEGKGKYFLRTKLYDGEFKNGKFDGVGTLYFHVDAPYKNYKGEFKNGHFHGKGILTINKNVYEGEFENGEFIKGSATFNLLDENLIDKMQIIYKGEFKNRYPNGKGILEKVGEIYEGEFIDGLRHGNGTLTFKTGRKDKYIGEFKNGLATGKGTYIYENGDKYVGKFKDLMKHGQGVYTWKKSGQKREGKYENDIMVGEHVFYTKDGKVIRREKDGKVIYGENYGKVINGKIKIKMKSGDKFYTWIGNAKDGKPHGIGEIIGVGCFEFRNGSPIGMTRCN
jgi:hypothetical protein